MLAGPDTLQVMESPPPELAENEDSDIYGGMSCCALCSELALRSLD